MSMRGITSCQTWSGGAGNSAHVIGSIVDPFTGIIYLTSGVAHGQYGSKMIRRCIVRFVVDRKTKKQSIFLEKMYPSLDEGTKDSFISFIKRKTDGKLDVVYGPEVSGHPAAAHYIPMANIVKNMEVAYHPYRDSAMEYRTDDYDVAGDMKEKTDLVFSRVAAIVGTKVLSTARTIKMATIPEASKAAFRRIRGTGYYDDRSYQVYEDLVAGCKRLLGNEKLLNHKFVEDVIKAGLTSYCGELTATIVGQIKTTCRLRAFGALDNATVQRLADVASKKIIPLINDEIKKLAINKKTSKASDIPLDVPVYVKLLS